MCSPVTPYLTAFKPPASVSTLPPIEAQCIAGAGMYENGLFAKNFSISINRIPACTVIVNDVGSYSSNLFILIMSSEIPPSTVKLAPIKPVELPLGTIGIL